MEQHVEMAALEAALDLWPTNTDRREQYGTGSPEGVLTASVGTYYTDTAGTTGAWRWQKRTGAGNTGWAVADGDTGTRLVAASLINGWTVSGGGVWIRRVGPEVTLRVYAMTASAMTAIGFLTIPDGFKGIDSNGRGVLHTGTGPPAAVWRTGFSSNVIAIPGATTATPSLTGYVKWFTTDAWPTSLPGTAA